MGSGQSCFRCRRQGDGRDFNPLNRNKEEETDYREKQEYTTLAEWLSAENSEVHALKHISTRVHPSLLVEDDGGGGQLGCGQRRDSCSEQNKLLKVSEDKAGYGDLEGFATLGRSQSRKAKKRVSFRLPEKDEIIIYDSPERGCTEMETDIK